MPSANTRTLRRAIRGQDSAALEAMLSPEGRASTAGWHDPRTGGLTPWGAIAIAAIRAELRRRQQRATRRGWMRRATMHGNEH